MIEASELRKQYGDVHALRGISFAIGRGEVVGLLGPNGAGKTTAMKILTGYLLPDGGTARVAGHDVVDEPRAVQARIGYLPENAPLYHDMMAQEYLSFLAAMRELPPATARRRIVAVAEQCGIVPVLTRPIGHLSKGYRQRVGLAGALLHDPEILILDEPTTGLDPNQIVEVRDLIRGMGGSKTILLSTHILPEVEITCDRVLMILDGRVRVDERLEDLKSAGALRLRVAVDDAEEVRRTLESVPGVTGVQAAPRQDGVIAFRIAVSGGGEVAERVWRAAAERRWPVRELAPEERTLEQVFRSLTETQAEFGTADLRREVPS